ncbi:hypothetical protein MKW94_006401 [Papaver nudicaule]|uniref:C2H2-type domain-containing protein n=1 Tax=Papaver nudicaule TaxID=74823 RepID=A0AA41S0Q6_PAPNU|nr:hypothetical protein [Papaver nudicaule]
MKSHMAILQTPPKVEHTKFNFQQQEQIRNEAAESSEEEEDDDEEEEMKNGLYYGLREHPKKSFRLVDPIFSSSTAATMEVGNNSSSVIIDRESETDESFKNNNTPSLTRRRSKRNRRTPISQKDQYLITYNEQIHSNIKKMKKLKKSSTKAEAFAPVESEPVSSVSDNTIEEDVAFSLMMLSRDTWEQVAEKSMEIEDDYDSEEEIIKLTSRTAAATTRKKYQCDSCKKVFRSYQALGGHRANHSKINGGCILPSTTTTSTIKADQSNADDYLKCPVCFKSFKSRQALGGHKRIHFSADLSGANYNTTSSSTTPVSAASNSIKFRESLIDLNLPAPIEEDDNSDFIDLI